MDSSQRALQNNDFFLKFQVSFSIFFLPKTEKYSKE